MALRTAAEIAMERTTTPTNPYREVTQGWDQYHQRRRAAQQRLNQQQFHQAPPSQPKPQGPTHRCFLPGCPVEGLGKDRQNVLIHEEHVTRSGLPLREAQAFDAMLDYHLKRRGY